MLAEDVFLCRLCDDFLFQVGTGNCPMIPQTRGEIYRRAVDRFESLRPECKAVDTIGSIAFIHPKKIERACRDEATFTVEEEERFFLTCGFPEGFSMKMQLLFPQLYRTVAPAVAEVVKKGRKR